MMLDTVLVGSFYEKNTPRQIFVAVTRFNIRFYDTIFGIRRYFS